MKKSGSWRDVQHVTYFLINKTTFQVGLQYLEGAIMATSIHGSWLD